MNSVSMIARPPAAFTSGLSLMSVPRPAMLVAIVTVPLKPALATMSASFLWSFAFSTLCSILRIVSILLSISEISTEVKAAGGLAIIGTERHESRRVDRQLRGRAGRQGDPGSSVFFVSLEDDLMRLFSSDRIASVMDKLGFQEGEMIEHKMISNSIERAQKKVEENNFGPRSY